MFEDLAYAIRGIILRMEGDQQSVVGLDVTYINMDVTQDYLRPLPAVTIGVLSVQELGSANGLESPPQNRHQNKRHASQSSSTFAGLLETTTV